MRLASGFRPGYHSAWRIGSLAHPLFGTEGARRIGGRWNMKGDPVLYAGGSYAVALLETLGRLNRAKMPENFGYIRIDIPESASIEIVDPKDLPGWNEIPPNPVTQWFGRRWLDERRSLALIVPSVLAPQFESNWILNPVHPAYADLLVTEAQSVHWDPRLFG